MTGGQPAPILRGVRIRMTQSRRMTRSRPMDPAGPVERTRDAPPEAMGARPGHRPPWTRWIDGELAIVAAGIGLGSLALGGRHEFTAVRSALLGAAILPWLLEVRITFPRLPFAAWVLG